MVQKANGSRGKGEKDRREERKVKNELLRFG
jgi:hypothetical protein